MDISDLARDLKIHEDVLKTALDDAGRLLRVSGDNVRTADKKALRGVAKRLEATIERLADEAVRDRLVEAVFQAPEGPDEDGLAYYTAWRAAQDRVDRTIEGGRDLLALVRAGDELKRPAGRPRDDHCTVAIRSLLAFWFHDLGREVTISGHPDDGRDVKPSATLRFVHRSMRLLGENISEQACRTILGNLCSENPDCPGSLL